MIKVYCVECDRQTGLVHKMPHFKWGPKNENRSASIFLRITSNQKRNTNQGKGLWTFLAHRMRTRPLYTLGLFFICSVSVTDESLIGKGWLCRKSLFISGVILKHELCYFKYDTHYSGGWVILFVEIIEVHGTVFTESTPVNADNLVNLVILKAVPRRLVFCVLNTDEWLQCYIYLNRSASSN